MGKENVHRTVQRRYSQGHHQNQSTHVEKNYKKEEEQPLCPLCEIDDDIDTDRKHKNIKNNAEEEWEEVVHIFRETKRKKEEGREKV